MERTFGWRHFRVQQKRKEGKDTFVLMVSTCDPDTQFWVSLFDTLVLCPACLRCCFAH